MKNNKRLYTIFKFLFYIGGFLLMVEGCLISAQLISYSSYTVAGITIAAFGVIFVVEAMRLED